MGRLGAVGRMMLALTAAGALAVLAGAGISVRAEQAIPEQQVKAAYILNFTRYANWPAPALVEPHAPLVVCLVGPGAADMARQLQHRAAGSHPLELRIVSRVEETEPCHAVYLALPERSRQSAWLTRMREQAILTIGDSANFLADGGMINMMLVDGSIRFEVNLTAAKHSGVSLNPRMLALAERVVGGDAK
ncbi:YfiR family protein [Rugamonas aquatica]|nr:YfiR family protein [Rugamonas aquatica]